MRASSGALRRLRGLRNRIQSPSDALLTLRLLGWRLTLPRLKRRVPIRRLVRLMRSRRPAAACGTDRIIELVDWIYAPRREPEPDTCLERSLLLYRFLSRQEPETRLVLGVRRGSEALEGHAWVIAGGRALGAVPPSGEDFVPLTAFDAEGRRTERVAWR